MSIVFNYIQKYPQRTKQLLGISHEQYQGLLKAALNEHIKIQTEKEKHKIRINSRGYPLLASFFTKE
ncbi:hypothetical protein [Mastigocoleus testarum]|uniref:Uncharacterized protein n=1 Tax=Mastigocoleus testarum BC008 TaxID=371196 RepID=A0A0V7ZW33_9CYAN|nr:hypothetical protein [Mastigocoleus testarum]KST68510.1 hypothetical protein BC008_01185 [Mastigocoleus testarum BC008]KST68667.1 hypothetical protein BC008_01540 [Mastigocoleus testarum BC008]